VKIVIIGGTGLIGPKTATILRERDHEVLVRFKAEELQRFVAERAKQAA
jgi:NAD dependent epimerase/dehydratase family enzyme